MINGECVIEFKGKKSNAYIGEGFSLASEVSEARPFPNERAARKWLKGKFFRREPNLLFLF